jgi:hypothetical protein
MAALKVAMADDPVAFMRCAATLMPKESEVTLRTARAEDLTDDELAAIIKDGSGDDDSETADNPGLAH